MLVILHRLRWSPKAPLVRAIVGDSAAADLEAE
jgi:hypothetical protein